ncbi:MAG: hypothetical protein GVY11_05770 [Gammaproteobacteria bacterium]|jgi:lycopene beta-cyclase|nr:hypothetical protein [Gammaproteobacteria bacterium]
MNDVELIVVGAGCAGLALGAALSGLGRATPRTLLVDGREAYSDDRTWSFWAEAGNPWLERAAASWSAWRIGRLNAPAHTLHSDRLRYASLRAIDYYRVQLGAIERNGDIQLSRNTRVRSIEWQDGRFRVETDAGVLTARQVVDTRPDPEGAPPMLWQQFSGLEIQCAQGRFDAGAAGLMLDMDCDEQGFIFTYLLPFAPDHALVESTRFSASRLPAEQLERDTARALARCHDTGEVEILRREAGLLPMGFWPESNHDAHQPVRAGAAGGALRSASGYGFLRMQAWADRCAKRLAKQGKALPHPPEPTWRRLMDRRFLGVIQGRPDLAPALFERMASRLPGDRLARFLSDEARASDVLAMIAAMPKRAFLFPPHRSSRADGVFTL